MDSLPNTKLKPNPIITNKNPNKIINKNPNQLRKEDSQAARRKKFVGNL